MYGFICIYTKLNNKHLGYLSIKIINLVILLLEFENTEGGNIWKSSQIPQNQINVRYNPQKNYLCSAEHSQ